MPSLPARLDLDQLRRRAKDLLRAAKRGDPDAMARLRVVSGRLILDSARLAVAREHGFAGWSALKTEVDRREILDRCDVARLEVLLARQPALASTQMRSCAITRAGRVLSGMWRCCDKTPRGASGATCPGPQLSPLCCRRRARPSTASPETPRPR